MVYLKVASGIGAGLILNGRLYRGSSGLAGELGHLLVDPEGIVCRCGNRGLSGDARGDRRAGRAAAPQPRRGRDRGTDAASSPARATSAAGA